MGVRLYVCYLALMVLLTGGCSSPGSGPGSSELILFSTVGGSTFSDYVWTVGHDGSAPAPLLTPKPNQSYTAATGNSLRGGLVVTVHETDTGEVVEDHLYLYYPYERRWRRLLSDDLIEGNGVISPGDSRVAFMAARAARTDQYRLWVTDIATGNTRQLAAGEEGTWDAYPCWRPDGQRIAFLRLRRTPDGVISKLLSVASGGGEETVILGESESVLSFYYAPDGERLALWTKKGLEVLNLADGTRKVIVAADKIVPTYRIPAGNIAWSRTQDKLVYALFNTQTRASEMWTISSDGSNVIKIYDHREGRIQLPSFIRG